jgi:hypothetical protein
VTGETLTAAASNFERLRGNQANQTHTRKLWHFRSTAERVVKETQNIDAAISFASMGSVIMQATNIESIVGVRIT